MAKTAVATKTKTRYVAATRRRRSNPGFTVPLGIVAGFVPYLVDLKKGFDQGGAEMMSMYGVRSLTGYDYQGHTWDWRDMRYGLGPIVIGMGIHKFIGGSLGINRMLGRAKFPILRI